MVKIAFVSYADGSYVPVQAVLVRSIRKIHPDIPVFAFNSRTLIGGPPHKEAPYGFKVYAVQYVRSLGYDIIIWLDSPNRLVMPIDTWIPEIEKVGVYIQKDGWMCGEWANDKTLAEFEVTRDESMTISNCYACIYAFDFRHPMTQPFFDRWKKACDDGFFYGLGKNDKKTESEDPRCLGHRYDQTCAELIAYKMGIPLSPLVLGTYFKSWIEV